MKRFLFAILTLIAFTATAQIEHSIVLDAKSFRAVQQDALTGVNIDPIGLDHSRQACARIKIKFDRMNKAQIDALEVKMRSNTDLTKQKVADYYDNVLILEMTAKPNTRFYFYSPEFGESNEVTLNLEGNHEYEMLASLNQTFSIVVSSNTENVDIYLDDVFKGKTDGSKSLTIKEVMIGAHTLKAVYGTVSSQQRIDVNSGSILFRQNVDTAASRPQFVVFAVEPQSAVVTIDGKHYSLTDGAMRLVLESGTYNYTVSAAGYHSQSGTFTVSGSKVTKQIALTADVATVTLTVADNAEIWVNGEKVGNSRWSGTLNSGTYIFEAKKAGHSTTTTSKHITSDNPQQSYTLESPKPLFGSLIVDGSPLMADVAIDGKSVGRTPLQLDNLLVGEHKLTVSKSDYQPYAAIITIAEGKTATVNVALTKQATQTQGATSQIIANRKTSAPYKVGDYYNENGKQGVVFEVSADGQSGKIVSLAQSQKLEWSDIELKQQRVIGAFNQTYGATNMLTVKQLEESYYYPAFLWCQRLGDGWYLPSIEELRKILLNKSISKAVNNTLEKIDAKNVIVPTNFYWSSTERDRDDALIANMYKDQYASKDAKSFFVRAVSTFGTASFPIAQTSAPYKVGDYYNDGVKEGVVFEVSADGSSGKILSLREELEYWCHSPHDKKVLGLDNVQDGSVNMDIIKGIKNWRKKYPAFAFCADLGEGWYLPAFGELETFTLNSSVCDAVNKTLSTLGAQMIWDESAHVGYLSSTEYSYRSSLGDPQILTVDGLLGKKQFKPETKLSAGHIRAVSKF